MTKEKSLALRDVACRLQSMSEGKGEEERALGGQGGRLAPTSRLRHGPDSLVCPRLWPEPTPAWKAMELRGWGALSGNEKGLKAC